MNPLVLLGLGSVAFGLAVVVLTVTLEGSGRSEPRSLSARKVFHVLVFTGAVPAQLWAGFWGVVVYGTVLAALVLLAVGRGEESTFYRALARPDAGRGGRGSVLVPLTATVLGGLTAVLLVGEFAIVGYLVAGWGDAAGEGVGRRWGRHRYSLPFTTRKGKRRSLEGSIAVTVAGWGGAWLALGILGFGGLRASEIALLCAVGGAVAEGVSGEGTDNFWVQVVTALGAWWLAG